MQYKVVRVYNKEHSIDSDMAIQRELEKTLNELAKEGWRLAFINEWGSVLLVTLCKD
ncbi:MAG: DUF4177 domain-containing protein [Victivallales bacterium]|nr:DUF4177 domain-containing protein [Victivallales bacterium]